MFMQEKLNIEKSIELLDKGFEGVPKSCYDNLFANLTSLYRLEEQGHKIEPLFCFIDFAEKMYTRHACFIMDGEIIDTTLATLYKKNKDKLLPNYVELKRYTTETYWKAIEKERVTSLDETLFKETLEGCKMFMSKGLFVVG